MTPKQIIGHLLREKLFKNSAKHGRILLAFFSIKPSKAEKKHPLKQHQPFENGQISRCHDAVPTQIRSRGGRYQPIPSQTKNNPHS